ncbi:GFA family protein [Ensifer adhaerens]|uniref:GFA family protein n=1 Tax=Ensifer adhaerens TaxID=106592 RepID=UPI0023A9EA6B|nr:GFA family protein [Ensifer adhaerens]WDZ77247.1 GFA family protein [Ensifer adhaerens]
MQRPYRLSCHCGDICFEVDEDLTGLVDCNCSTCRRSGFLHWKVDAANVKLLTEKRRLSSYIWRGLNEGHQFCPTCGTPVLRSGYPDNKISVNARCIENIDVFTLEIERYDGRNDMFPGPLP